METFDIYQDIMTRTGGDIYIGVVGPVRTGKSTFIKKFMEQLVVPSIDDEYRRNRVIDELPQSASGKTIMTTEPKFVPDGGVRVEFGDGLDANVRLIDSVGYIVDDAEGYSDEAGDRYVSTPWSDEKMTFREAGEYGTKKVIVEHSTVGVVVTTDGSICGIDRASYEESEERVIRDMQAIGKPFVILLNTANPTSPSTIALQKKLFDKYNVSVICLDIANMNRADIDNILRNILLEFRVRCIEIDLPSYMQGLGLDNYIIDDIAKNMRLKSLDVNKMADYSRMIQDNSSDYIESISIEKIDFGKGVIQLAVKARENLFYEVISAETGVDIKSDAKLVEYIKRLSVAESLYSKLGDAIDEADKMNYSVVMPSLDEISVSEPTISKKGGKCQVKLTAKASSLHIMKVDIETDICPIMGSEEQCNEMIEYINKEAEDKGIMDVTLFSKPMSKLIGDEIENRANEVSPETRSKMVKTMTRIVNEGKGGVLLVLI